MIACLKDTSSRDQALAVLSASRESLLNARTSTEARLELMREAANDELFMADLNATLEDFRDADKLDFAYQTVNSKQQTVNGKQQKASEE